MAAQLLVDIDHLLRELCAERAIPVDAVRFFGSRALGTARDDSDVDVALISPTFEGKDIFQRAALTKENSPGVGEAVRRAVRYRILFRE